MKIALAEEMRQIDSIAADKYGIPEILLMENAGKATADVFTNILGGLAGKMAVIIAGSGNNGGDAFVAARHIANRGAKVRVFLLGTAAHLKPAAALNRDICVKMGLDVYALDEERDWDRLGISLRFADGIVDGIIGTGFSGELRPDTAKLIKLINDSGKPVVSIDLPSGVNSDTGAVSTVAVRADMTVTLGVPKPGHFFCPGAAHTGRLVVDDIGLPSQLLNEDSIEQEYLDDDLARGLLQERPLDVHKGDCGRILVVAGSKGMTGAAALSGSAALRVGAGIVTVAIPASLNEIMEIKLTEAMTLPIDDSGNGFFSGSALDSLLEAAEKYDAVLIGPGLGREEETSKLIRSFCSLTEKPLIIDADALYAYRDHTEEFKELKNVPILTPHLGEMAGLLGKTTEEIRGDILGCVKMAAKEWGAAVVLKSECTTVALPSGNIWITSKGNPGMATAGSGDVLAGAIAGLMKQMDGGAAPLMGVYLHGLAGDIVAREKGIGIIAGDILNSLPKAWLSLRNNDIATD